MAVAKKGEAPPVQKRRGAPRAFSLRRPRGRPPERGEPRLSPSERRAKYLKVTQGRLRSTSYITVSAQVSGAAAPRLLLASA